MMTYALMAPRKSVSMPQSNLKNNFGLSVDRYSQLVDKLKIGDESLLRHIAQNHFDSCIKYLMHNCKVSESQAYDLCLDTMLIFRNKLLADKITYGNLNYLYTRMAKNALVDKIKKDKRIQTAVDLFTIHDSSDDNENEKQMFEVLEESMSELDEGSHTLIKEIYFSDKDIHQVAEQQNISYATLRKRKQRLLEKLKGLILNNLSKNNF